MGPRFDVTAELAPQASPHLRPTPVGLRQPLLRLTSFSAQPTSKLRHASSTTGQEQARPASPPPTAAGPSRAQIKNGQEHRHPRQPVKPGEH
ncbi:hypothetical protein NDU88_002538 [Pleurodeles waltl]|uniref:Uncharacterized protein n=1 Tax=Pleurodeles waltl TaxID=8319 RepID=A0AAV7T286_PLEWA|nr:hypothetical protein NDU88_002538 [Pleurodeles waltl]